MRDKEEGQLDASALTALTDFQTGVSNLLCGTSGIATGVDYPAVDEVVMVGAQTKFVQR